MTTFAQAFWSNDYAGGLGVLFGKLQQGVQENQQILTIARMRADAEELYGQHMGDIGPATDRITGGFARDDGASVRKAYDGVRTEMEEASRKHRKISSNIRELVVYPFGRWCDQHAARVQNSQDDLQGRIKAHDRQADVVRKLRSHYFNKCRLVEDLEEEDKLAFKEPQASPSSSSSKAETPIVKVSEPKDDFEDEEEASYEIGDSIYQHDQLKKILVLIMDSVKMSETKVPILGTYQNCSSGADIVEFIQKNMEGSSVSYAERVGQDLINNGFLRLVGNVGNMFANSSRMSYQWRPKAFKLTGLPEKQKPLDRASTTMSLDSLDNPLVGTVQEYLSGWNPLNNPYPNETPGQKLRRESREADERYKAAVRKLDLLRCTLEEAMFEHLKFMERCELDRLKAIKAVILDFSGAISNVIPSLQSTVDKMMLFQETVQPLGDLRYMLENYRTGSYVPRVQPYENYYNSIDEQTFGIDLEARARADRKRVPLIITTILTHLDNSYPLLDGDEARRAIWTVDVPLAATHRLRNDINGGEHQISVELLSKYEIPIVASVLKLYLLELPDSVVSSGLYEIIKTIYTSAATSSEAAVQTRVSVLQNTLGQLRLANIASLDAITTHFARLIDLTSADDTYVGQLASSLAPCILRSRTESALNFEEKYNVRFLRDLLGHKDAIFGELKRSAALQHSASVARAQSTVAPHSPHASATDVDGRARAISTDESNRRAHMEERNRAIANRSRHASPAPGSREFPNTNGPSAGHDGHSTARANHRRDSSRGPETRFPVSVGGATPVRGHGASISSPRSSAGTRGSLEVPGGGSPTHDRHVASAANGGANGGVTSATGVPSTDSPTITNGHTTIGDTAPLKATPEEDPNAVAAAEAEAKRDSLGRTRGLRKAGANSQGSAAGTRDSAGSVREARASLEGTRDAGRGVELVDRPMDD